MNQRSEMSLTITKITPNPATTCIWGKNDCFEIATWFVEGDFYCDDHKNELMEIVASVKT